MKMNEKIISVNNKFVNEIGLDGALHYGYGATEVLRSYNNRIYKLDEHIGRLFNSAKSLNLKIDRTPSQLKNEIINIFNKSKIKEAKIRVSVTGIQHPQIVIIIQKFRSLPKEYYQYGVSVKTSHFRRYNVDGINPQIKSCNFLWGVLCNIEFRNKYFFETILLNKEGYVTEGTISNIFSYKNNIVFTPPVYCNILRGITRDTVIEIAKEVGIKIEETPFTLHQLYTADEVFLTNTSIEILPVVRVDDRIINNGKVGPLTSELLKKFRYLTQKI